MTDLNSNRPVFQECNPNDIRSKIGQYVPSEKTSCRGILSLSLFMFMVL